MQVIIPTTDKDYRRVKRDLDSLTELLDTDELIFIGPEGLEEQVCRDKENMRHPERISYLNENSLIEYSHMKETLGRVLAEHGYIPDENSRPGWYYQQFLKMAFSYVCKGDYYMSWDADTIPMRRINMFDENKHPCFDIKSEYIPGYFVTIKRLLGMDKQIEMSFISEHMVFSKNRMQELLAEIEGLPIKGERFYEKILFGMGIDNMLRGFSEFETYGTWMCCRHPGEYTLRKWSSMRIAGAFMKPEEISEEDRSYLARDYDSITFESYHKFSPELAEFFHNPRYREKVSASQFYRIVLESGFFGELLRDGIKSGEEIFPV